MLTLKVSWGIYRIKPYLLEGKVSIYIIWNFSVRKFIFLPYLVIYLYNCRLMYIYFILWVTSQYFILPHCSTFILYIKIFIICKRVELNEIIFVVPSSSKVLAQELLKINLNARHSKIIFSIFLPDRVVLALGFTFLITFLGYPFGSFICYWHQRTYV